MFTCSSKSTGYGGAAVAQPGNDRICWKCREKIPDAHQLNSIEMMFARPPVPGDISICGSCGAFAIFNGLLQLEKPDAVKMRQITNTPELMDAQARILER
jgi:hypothetical protein